MPTQAIVSIDDTQTTVEPKYKAKKMIAKWKLIEGKLTCVWSRK